MSKKNLNRSATAFVIIMGIVSMFSDMTHEGARSIYGVYLNSLGASAAVIGFVSGLGQLFSYALRLFTGKLADKYKKYWIFTVTGYIINMLAVPALALAGENGWIFACSLIVAERMGKAIRQPAKNALVSFAAAQVGAGKSFALQEALDQIGAFLGPVILFATLYLQKVSGAPLDYRLCFKILAVPAFITLICVAAAAHIFPSPENFEKKVSPVRVNNLKRIFYIYLAASACIAFGFIDFPLITMHFSKIHLCAAETLPLLYAGAMLTDAISALAFGYMFDSVGAKVIIYPVLAAAFSPLLLFAGKSIGAAWVGVALWGIGMGAQESVLKSAVASVIPKNLRSTAFGTYGAVFGIMMFAGNWLAGILYDRSLFLMITLSAVSQAAAVPLLISASDKYRRGKK